MCTYIFPWRKFTPRLFEKFTRSSCKITWRNIPESNLFLHLHVSTVQSTLNCTIIYISSSDTKMVTNFEILLLFGCYYNNILTVQLLVTCCCVICVTRQFLACVGYVPLANLHLANVSSRNSLSVSANSITTPLARQPLMDICCTSCVGYKYPWTKELYWNQTLNVVFAGV